MVSLGRWIQCEIAEGLCNPFMLKNGKIVDETVFKGKPVDVVEWSSSLIIASSKFRIYVEKGTATPVQYYTEFYEGLVKKKLLGFNEVNMTDFTPGRPDPSVFSFPGRVMGTCADRVCTTYAESVAKGAHPIDAFTGWR